jgi:hypothetical protein
VSPQQCPDWCEGGTVHEGVHYRGVGQVSRVNVAVIQDNGWTAPRIYVGYHQYPPGTADVVVPWQEATGLAELLGMLRHRRLEELIKQAVEVARP